MYLYPFEDHGPRDEGDVAGPVGAWTAWLEVHLAEEARPVT